jgi:hypothetical protein
MELIAARIPPVLLLQIEVKVRKSMDLIDLVWSICY